MILSDRAGEQREKMIQQQLVARGIKDARVISAFRRIERKLFVPENIAAGGYCDYPLPIGEGQTISQPYIAALMTQALELKGGEKVLEIGTGSGFQTAVLAELASEVCTVERLSGLAEKAQNLLSKLGYSNIRFRVGNGSAGWPEEAPFDRIIVTAAAQHLPEKLFEQLSDNGIMVIPLGGAFSQTLTLFKKGENGTEISDLCPCVFVPLIENSGNDASSGESK